MIVDSGATSHFGRTDGHFVATNEKSNKKVFLPDGSKIPATNKAILPFDTVPADAKEVHILPKLKHSLLSVGKFADRGYTTIFHPYQEGVTIHRQGTIKIEHSCEPDLQGCRAKSGLWEMALVEQQHKTITLKEQLNSVYDLPSTSMRIKYLHAAAGFPVRDTWVAAIKAGNYSSWPGLTAKAVIRYYPESDETAKGHMKRQRQNVRSTKIELQSVPMPTTQAEHLPKHKELYLFVFNAKDTMYTDQTGQFPITSMRRNKYIMIMYEVNGNYIDAEPFKNKTDDELTKTYQAMWARLAESEEEITPTLHILDNEAPIGLKMAIKQNCKYQLVPPDTHRRNLAERAIQTFKSHFVSILAGVDPKFPIKCWDRLVPQAVVTLNLLRQSNSIPEISAYAYRHGCFDYNATPLAPLGCAVQIHSAVERRSTWGEHSLDGWYLGTSLEHYRCHNVHVTKTNSERISDTILFRHKYITDPFVTPEDRLMKAVSDLKHKLLKTNNVDGYKQLAALKKLDAIHKTQADMALTGKVGFTDHPTIIRFDPEAPPKAIAVQTPRVTIHRKCIETQTTPVQPRHTGPAANTRSSTTSRQQALSTMEHNLAIANETVADAWSELACAAVMDENGNTLRYRQLITHPQYKKEWSISSANEFGRLAQGVGGRVKGTDTIKFIPRCNVPQDRWKDVTYAKFVCELKPNKAEIHRTRLTVSGNRINYPGDVGTPTGDLLLVKVLLNSVISTAHAKFMTLDIKNFYLNTPMTRYEYVCLKLDDVPDEIIVEYNLREKASDGFIYLEIQKGMYGLPQAGILAQELLEKRLNKHGYFQSKLIPGLWTHETRPICFSLVVDDFGVKYVGEEHAKHLATVLKEHYEIEEDWSGSKYIGLTLDWDYQRGQVHLSMPSYVSKLYKNSSMKHRDEHKTHRIHIPHQNMELKSNMWTCPMNPKHWTRMQRNISKLSLEHFFTTPEQSTAPCSPPSAPLPLSRHPQLKTPSQR